MGGRLWIYCNAVTETQLACAVIMDHYDFNGTCMREETVGSTAGGG
jgi:hypothetical protein